MKTRVSLKYFVNDCSISYPYFTNVSSFAVKLKLPRKSSDFVLLGVAYIALISKFMKINFIIPG